jgi:hypothetical protein
MEYTKNTELYLYYNESWFHISPKAPDTALRMAYAPARINIAREGKKLVLIAWDGMANTEWVVEDELANKLVAALLPTLLKEQEYSTEMHKRVAAREKGQLDAEAEACRLTLALQSKEADAIRERIRAEKAEAALKNAQDEASDNFVAAFAIGAAVAGVVGLIIGAIIGASSSEDEVAEDAPARVIFFVMDQAAPSVVG